MAAAEGRKCCNFDASHPWKMQYNFKIVPSTFFLKKKTKYMDRLLEDFWTGIEIIVGVSPPPHNPLMCVPARQTDFLTYHQNEFDI